MLLIHGTGTGAGVFEPAAARLRRSFRVISPDRRGWGNAPAETDYRRTSIAEQAIELAGLLRDEAGPRQAAVAGIGLGAVIALELALAEPDLVGAVLMIEPPILGLLPAATALISADAEAIRAAATNGGEEAAYRLFLEGRLPALGAGAERFAASADHGPEAARSFLVELPAVPAWPLDPVRLAGLEAEVTVATCPSTPGLLREAGDAAAARIPGCRRLEARGEPAEVPLDLLP